MKRDTKPKISRAISLPFTDLANLLSRSRSNKNKKGKKKEKKIVVPHSTFREEFSSTEQQPRLRPQPLESPSLFANYSFERVSDLKEEEEEESFEYLSNNDDDEEVISSHQRRKRIGGRGGHHRECSTVLEESSSLENGEEGEVSFFSTHQTFEEGESFVTARDHQVLLSSIDTSSRRQPPQFEDAEEEEEEDSPNSSSFESSTHHREEGVSTPDTSFPSTPGIDDDEKSLYRSLASSTPLKGNLRQQEQDLVNFNFTPPKPPPRFLEVVETCPTPEHQHQHQHQGSEQVTAVAVNSGEEQGREEDQEVQTIESSPLTKRRDPSESTRRRSLLKSSTLESYAPYYHEEGEQEVAKSWKYVSPTNSILELNRSRTPSLIGLGPQQQEQKTQIDSSTPTTPRKDRHRRCEHSRESTSGSTGRTDLFPTISATELVVASLLSSESIVSTVRQQQQVGDPRRYSSNSSYCFDPTNSPPPPPPLTRTRPLSQPFHHHRSNRYSPNSQSQFQSHSHSHSHSPLLLPKASSTTLYTYDLSHLPAPQTPLEKPYRVDWKDLLKPSTCLGGGKGSGKFGDRYGAVERKNQALSSSSSRDRRRSSLLRPHLTVGEEDIEEDDQEARRVDTPIPGSTKREGSIRRSLSRLSIRIKKGISILDRVVQEEGEEKEEDTEIVEKVKRSKSIRTSLSRSLSTTFSISGRQRNRRREEEKEEILGRRSSREKLDQWINVVVT
ncbi:hypothetical protein JCM5350_007584 [Sporobolomyces pararoseus]